MPTIPPDEDDLFAVFQANIPTGPVWPRESDAIQTQILRALIPSFARSAARGANLIDDCFPATTLELLPEWEESLGLPDPCAGESPTIQQRQQQVVARFAAGGGQSKAFFIDYAAALGYRITITEFAPFRFGETFGKPLNGPDWAHAWQVNAPSFSIERFTFGLDAFGEPFAEWSNDVLQCELNRLKPAHTVLTFNYKSGGVLGQFVLGVDVLGDGSSPTAQTAPLDEFILDVSVLS